MAFGVAGALPFVAGGRRLLAQRVGVGSARPVRDPVIDQISRELARIQTSMQKHGMRAEQVHGFAGQVRVLIAHADATRLDDRVKRGVGQAIDAHGRDTIIDTEIDEKQLNAQLASLGADTSHLAPRRRMERAKRAELLDSLLVGGVTPHLDRLNAALVRAEGRSERFGAGEVIGRPGVLVQDCWQSWGVLVDMMTGAAEFCAWFAPELSAWFGLAAAMCEVGMYVDCWGG
jgi:hypothetical protein